VRIGDPGATACPACGGGLVAWKSVQASEPALAGVHFELLRCQRCGSAVTVGEAGPDLYDSGAYSAGDPRLYALARPLLRAFDRARLALVRELVPAPARLLDVGAGRGRFVASARTAGYDAWGLEPSLRGAAAATAIDVPVLRTTIAEATIEARSLDAVTSWHVLEHLDEPGDALGRIASWLRPGGGLVVGVPNLDSWQARAGGDRWYHLDVPRHRVHFTPAGLDALLRSHGFEPVRTTHRLAEHNPFGMWQSLVSRVTRHPSYLYNVLKRNAPLRSPDLALTVLALTLLPPAALAELLAGAVGHGGTIAVLARRLGDA
jgi:SAM-dependent methyltransferase